MKSLFLAVLLLASASQADEGLLISSYDYTLQTSSLDRYLNAIGNDIASNGELSAATKEMIRHDYKSRKIVQEGFLAGSSRDAREKTLAWARNQFRDAGAMLDQLEKNDGEKNKIAAWRAELNSLLRSSEETLSTEQFRTLIGRSYSVVQEIYSSLKEKDPKALLPVMRTVEPSSFQFSLDVMEKAEAQIRDFFLTKWKPAGGAPVSMAARERLARLTTDMYFLHHYPVRDDNGGKLQAVFDRMNESLRKDELLRVAHKLRETQEKLDEFRDSVEPMCLLTSNKEKDFDSLAPEFLVTGTTLSEGGLPDYCQAILARGMGSCFRGKNTSKRIVIDPGHLGGAFTKDDRDHLGYREGLSNYLSSNLVRLLLSQCMGYDKNNIILTRHDVESVGGVAFDKNKKRLEGTPTQHVCAYDDLDFRGAYIASLKPDFFVSIHTDGTPEQRGTVYMPRPGADVESLMYKDNGKTSASEKAGDELRLGLNQAFYSPRAGGKSCAEQIGFARKEIGKGYGDYAVFRETPHGVPTLIIEGFSHAPENPRRDLVEAFHDSDAQRKNTERAYIDGKWYSYHSVLRCYAEGIAMGIAASMGCK